MGFIQRLFGGGKADAPGLDVLRVDVHSHLVPAIDDGSKTVEDSVEMIRALVDLGYRKLITTPHIMSDAYRNTPETILGGLEDVRKACQEAGIEVELEGAAEYYLDEKFAEKIGKEPLMTFGGDEKYLLFETSYVDQPMSLREVVFQLNAHGYQPVMAHPERYQYYWDGDALEDIRAVRDRGVLMQVNIGSFAGRYSRRAAKIANELAAEGLIDFLGTDIHRLRQVESMERALKGNRYLRELLESGNLRNASLF